MARLDLRAKFIVEGFISGLHASPFHGFSVEFSEHRRLRTSRTGRGATTRAIRRRPMSKGSTMTSASRRMRALSAMLVVVVMLLVPAAARGALSPPRPDGKVRATKQGRGRGR